MILLKKQEESHSYCHEIESFHFALRDTDRNLKIRHVIEHGMDCQAGITSLEKKAYKPKHNTRMDSDIIMSHRKLIEEIAHDVSHK